jgi:drug/metabolite transporter (DMT)-like permease
MKVLETLQVEAGPIGLLPTQISKEPSYQMLGWMLIFTLMTLAAAATAVAGGIGFTPGTTATLVFGFLLVVSLLTRALRGQA